MIEWAIKQAFTYALPYLVKFILGEMSDIIHPKIKKEEPLSKEDILYIREKLNKIDGSTG